MGVFQGVVRIDMSRRPASDQQMLTMGKGDAGGRGDAGIAVAQIMEAHIIKPGSLADALFQW